VAVVFGAAITWQVHQWKLRETARVCRTSAEQGDAKAQFRLGFMYARGKGVPQDYAEALRWCRKAADQGNAKGEDAVAYMYFHGQGAPQDYAVAFRWWQKAADQGYAPAQASLGNMYYYGDGAPQDSAEAARWYRKAADQGYAIAQYSLGYMYYYGYGVPQDRAEADRWFHKAADQGDEEAKRVLRRKMSTLLKIDYSVLALGSLLLLISSGLLRRLFRGRQQRTAAMAGILGLSYVAMGLFGFYHFGICEPGLAVDAFYLAKSILGGIAVFMFISIVWPESVKPKSAKIALGVFGILFIGFNLFAVAHQDLARFTPAVRLFRTVNGELIGISVSLAVYLWRTHKKARGGQSGNGETAVSESPSESGRESNT
jgi:hypothetical protein